MNFLNLSLGELLGLAGVLSAGVVALYLFDRTRRRRIVATLRFWAPSEISSEWKRSRRVQQPWSLILQILSMLLLLAAIAGPRLGGSLAARDHVLILDTSAWMGARTRQGILLDQAKTTALSYLNSLPPGDPVMLVRADALATPVTPFETRHQIVADAIRQSQPSASALSLQPALNFATNAQRLQSGRAGEIAFAGAARVSKEEAESLAPPPNFRLLQIPSSGENVGLKKLGLRRSPSSPESWEAYVSVKNDGVRAREVAVDLRSGTTDLGTKTVKIPPGAEVATTFTFKLAEAGLLEARIHSTDNRDDAFPQDDRAALDLPALTTVRVVVYSNNPESLQPLLVGHPQVDAKFESPSRYNPSIEADVLVFDRFAPPQPPTGREIVWIDPPAGSPFAIRGTQTNAKLERWRAESPLAAGLYTKDLELASTKIFEPSKNDQSVAETSRGPVVIARTMPSKMVALGFQPTGPSMKYQLATPLLIANILRWMAPDTFRRWDIQAATVGTVSVPVEKGTDASKIRVTGDRGRPLPFTVQGEVLRFFSGAPGAVHVHDGDRETVYSLSLPDVGEAAWKAPPTVARGVPRLAGGVASVANIWPWLALLGGLGLLIEWLLYGRGAMVHLRAARTAPAWTSRMKIPWRKAS
ncbi:MAG TPA: VWA domain-containing protein [Bryobacteraceae bacterium]|nr:VWA domain-containing protein [Bryobacteraceae bacterium]